MRVTSATDTTIAPPSAPERRPSTGRIVGLDRLRGVALLLMLVQHFVGWFGGDARRILPGWRWYVVTDVCAPAFAVAAGASLHLFVETQRRNGVDGPNLHATVARRYGLLVPMGAALGFVVFGNPYAFGVLEALGVATMIAYVAGRALSPGVAAPLAVAALMADAAVGRVAGAWDHGSFAYRVLQGTFPVATYTGFALIGTLGAAALRGRDRPGPALKLGLLLAATTSFMAAAGQPPDRYPATPAFVVPSLAGTLLLYAALAAWRAGPRNPVVALIEGAAAHTFGVFIAHYGVYLATRWWLDDVDPVPSVALALVLAGAFAAAAPRMPTLPWSPRRGRVSTGRAGS